MTGFTKVDPERALKLMRQGKNNAQIARIFKCSDENIRIMRKKAIERGDLEPGFKSPGYIHEPQRRPGRPPKVGAVAPVQPELSFEQTLETMITAFELAKEVPRLKAELTESKKRIEWFIDYAQGLEADIKKLQEQKQRFTLARQQSPAYGD